MREIKFRAWDEDAKEMLKWEELLCADDSCVKTILTEQPFIPMQYTGLKDKNDKEIYDGDRFQHGKSIGTITYEEDSFNVKWDEPNRDFWNDILKNHAKDGEVIGNIYEHPHLLKEEQGK